MIAPFYATFSRLKYGTGCSVLTLIAKAIRFPDDVPCTGQARACLNWHKMALIIM